MTQTATLAALNRLDTGVLVMDRSGRIAHANALAEDILAASRDIGVLNGRLCVKRPALPVAQQDFFSAQKGHS